MNVVQMSNLGSNGRFGNQLFQYAFARTYAERVGARLETPAWIGQLLFRIADPPVTRRLRQLSEGEVPEDSSKWVPNVDINGWFQKPIHLAHVSSWKVREWFRFRPHWLRRYPKQPQHYSACHLRQGDFSTDPGRYCLISRFSYRRAVACFAPADMPVIWVEEDKAVHDPDLSEDLQFLPDFLKLWNADVLFRSNSTYAWWAGELGEHEAVYSPLVGDLHGRHDVAFVPGNSEQHAPFAGYGPLRFGQP